jgi:hypothetical protein
VTQHALLASSRRSLSHPDVVESPSGPTVDDTDRSGRRILESDRSRRSALDHGTIGLHDVATNNSMTTTDHIEALPAATAGPPMGFVRELHVTPKNARQIISELHSMPEPEAEIGVTGVSQPGDAAESEDVLEPQAVIDARGVTQPPNISELITSPGPPTSEENVPQTTNPTQPLPLDASEKAPRPIATSNSSSHPNDALDIELELYIDGKANMNLAEPDAWLMLTDMTNRDELFRLAKDLLEALGHLDVGDEIVAVIFKRPDGEVIPGTSKTSIPITRVGQQDMWKRLVSNMSGAGTWKGELRGYVRVQKAVRGE